MQLSTDQELAITQLLAWHETENKPQYITLGGYAGTGKTTLISLLSEELNKKNKKISLAFCSYTGRATQNLKNKLKDNHTLTSKDIISTIHGLIYDPIENARGEIVGWEKKGDIDTDLIIADESSMIDENIWRDLLSYKVPIIAVGDHGQLPPINGKFNLMESPNILLNEIHRQEKNNPIIDVSIHARSSGEIPVKVFGKYVAKYSREDPYSQERSGELLENYSKDKLILCGYNSTRTKLNKYIRQNLGYETESPQSGDRVICLRNNTKKGIFNGMLGTINTLTKKDAQWYDAEIQMDDNVKPYTGLIYAPQFGAQTPINFTANRKHAAKGDLFDFGYALTVHKAQGSQAEEVILFEERFKQMDDIMWRKWLYTGVTRAEKQLYIFG